MLHFLIDHEVKFAISLSDHKNHRCVYYLWKPIYNSIGYFIIWRYIYGEIFNSGC